MFHDFLGIIQTCLVRLPIGYIAATSNLDVFVYGFGHFSRRVNGKTRNDAPNLKTVFHNVAERLVEELCLQ